MNWKYEYSGEWELPRDAARRFEGLLATRCFGPSISSSNPSTSTSSLQTTVQGSAGASSPTVTGAGNVNYTANDPTLQLNTVAALADAFKQIAGGSLAAVNDANAGVQQLTAQSQSSNADLIQQVLGAEQNLAAYQGSNGGVQQSQTTNYALWGAIAVAAVALLAVLFGNRK